MLFRRLAVFAGGAGLDAIETVCGGADIDEISVLDLLGSLIDKSLVVSTPDPDDRPDAVPSARDRSPVRDGGARRRR